MKFAVVLNIHANEDLVLDTIDSIRSYVTNDILVVVDGASKEWGQRLKVPAYKMQGLIHGCPSSPYRNLTLGLMTALDLFQETDWFCYAEADVLFASENFKKDIEEKSLSGFWCLGNDHRTNEGNLILLEKMLKTKFEQTHYLLGCCVFYKKEFLNKLKSIDFFERFLNLTNSFVGGYFPIFTEQGGYDLGEHLYPTLAAHYGGRVGSLATWDDKLNIWKGNYRRYPMRFRPDISEDFRSASILHPLKEINHPLRDYYRKERNG